MSFSQNQQWKSNNWRGLQKAAVVYPLLATELNWHREKERMAAEIKRLRSEVGLITKRYRGAQNEVQDMVTRLRAQPPPPVPERGSSDTIMEDAALPQPPPQPPQLPPPSPPPPSPSPPPPPPTSPTEEPHPTQQPKQAPPPQPETPEPLTQPPQKFLITQGKWYSFGTHKCQSCSWTPCAFWCRKMWYSDQQKEEGEKALEEDEKALAEAEARKEEGEKELEKLRKEGEEAEKRREALKSKKRQPIRRSRPPGSTYEAYARRVPTSEEMLEWSE